MTNPMPDSAARILIVEDDSAIRRIVCRMLDGKQYRLETANDGKEALDLFVAANDPPFDLVITDISMPRMSGEELLREVKARRPDVQVIMITALQDDESVVACFKADAYRYIRKPFQREELVRVVEAALRERAERLAAGSPAHVVSEADAGWVELTAPSRQEYIDRFQDFCVLLLETKLDDHTKDEIKIAIQELGQNAIEWGNKMDERSRIKVAYRLEADRISFRIEDEGQGFKPENVPDPTADPIGIIEQRERLGKRPGGFGIHLARKVMDRVHYNERGNVVVMEKLFRK